MADITNSIINHTSSSMQRVVAGMLTGLLVLLARINGLVKALQGHITPTSPVLFMAYV